MTSTVCKPLLGAALLALSGTSAMAGTLSLSTHFDQVKLGVIDLTPNDGVAASFSVTSMRTTYSQYLYRYPDEAGEGQNWYGGHGDSTPFTFTNQLGWGGVTGSTTGEVAGLSIAASVSDVSGFSATASSSVTQTVALNLAPHTILTFSGSFVRQFELTGAEPAKSATTYEGITLRAADGTWFTYRNDYDALAGGPLNTPFWFAMANTHDTAMTVNMVVNTNAFVTQAVLVPEPSTYAMLGLGLLTVGACARRRRSQQA